MKDREALSRKSAQWMSLASGCDWCGRRLLVYKGSIECVRRGTILSRSPGSGMPLALCGECDSKITRAAS